jgi:hypothetical protein
MTSAIQSTPSKTLFTTPTSSPAQSTPKRKHFDSAFTPTATAVPATPRRSFSIHKDNPKSTLDQKTDVVVRKTLRQTGLVLPDSSGFSSPVMTSSPALYQTSPARPILGSAAAAASNAEAIPVSPEGLVMPDMDAFSPKAQGVSPALPQPTPLRASSSSAAALAGGVPSNAMILTRLPAPTPEAPPVERENAIRTNAQKQKTNPNPLIQQLLTLTTQSTFPHNGTTYTRGKFLGRGQFVDTFATDKPGVVVKHLHEGAIYFDLYNKQVSYWAGVQTNYAAGQSISLSGNRKPMANVLNATSLTTQMFALQETVIPLDNLTAKDLTGIPSSIFPQIKEIIAAFFKQCIVIECHKKNLGISVATKTVVVYDADARANFDDEESVTENALGANLRDNLASYGAVAARYLNPAFAK